MLTFFVFLAELFDEWMLTTNQPVDDGRNGW
jgi:hypothetical protein